MSHWIKHSCWANRALPKSKWNPVSITNMMKDDLDVTEAVVLDHSTTILYVGQWSVGEGLMEEEAEACIDHFSPYFSLRGNMSPWGSKPLVPSSMKVAQSYKILWEDTEWIKQMEWKSGDQSGWERGCTLSPRVTSTPLLPVSQQGRTMMLCCLDCWILTHWHKS